MDVNTKYYHHYILFKQKLSHILSSVDQQRIQLPFYQNSQGVPLY